MSAPTSRGWFRGAVLVAAGYVAFGMGTAALARAAPSPGLVTAARLAAWSISALLFAGHIALVRRGRLPAPTSAMRTSTAVALATAALAVVAIVHQWRAGTLGARSLLAIVIWPALTSLVSFLVGLVIFALLARLARAGDGPRP